MLVDLPKNAKSLRGESWKESPYVFECESLSFDYGLGDSKMRALENLDFQIQSGDFIAISGPAGSGKSTLLNLLGMIEPLQSGQIRLDGLSYNALSESDRNWIKRFKIGFIFQNSNLIDVLNAQENVEYSVNSQGLPLAERKRRAEDALQSVQLWEHRFKKPHQLSGGQRQRVAIARALAKKPRVILADEPTASLDRRSGAEIIELLKKINKQENVTIIVSSHDPVVLERASKNLNLENGKIQNDIENRLV